MGLAHLHPRLQAAIANDLGWPSLRPVQAVASRVLAGGANAVILAPTAGGKTEAAFFPVLSRVLGEGLAPASALYLSPLKALLNDQEERLRRYARLVGLEVFTWHGDVSDGRKRAFAKAPADVLLTTPESLEGMLVSEREGSAARLSNVAAVIVDEVHAFAGDDRGAHLASLLERVAALAGRDLQRVGLSATVGNPATIGEWLQGSSRRPREVVQPPGAPARRALRVERSVDLDAVAQGIARLARGKKSLVFVESRASAEKTSEALSGRGVEVFIHHSAVSREDRALAEARFAAGQNTAIVATSTLELGLDVGDLDQVVQLDAPATVAAFLQRLGRAGRRPGAAARGTFFCLSAEALLRAVALLRLAQAGWVEDVRPPTGALHVLAQQVFGLVLQERGLPRRRLLRRSAGPTRSGAWGRRAWGGSSTPWWRGSSSPRPTGR